jgi:hypothetical protein
MRIKIIAGTLCLVWLAGCASTPPPVAYKSNPRWSEARNVMEAAYITGIKDMPYKQYQEAKDAALAKGIKLDTGPSLLGGTTFGALNYMSPPTGFSSGAAGLMGLASWMLIGKDHPGTHSRILFWMPANNESGLKDATSHLHKIYTEALNTAIKEVRWPDGYTAQLVNYPGSTGIFVVITGGECSKEAANPKPVPPTALRCRYGKFLDLDNQALPIAGIAPYFLGGGNAYVGQGIKYDQVFSYESTPSKVKLSSAGIIHEWYAGFPDLEFFQSFTRHLPKWVYVY